MAAMKSILGDGLAFLDEALDKAKRTEAESEEMYYKGLIDMFKCLTSMEVEIVGKHHMLK